MDQAVAYLQELQAAESSDEELEEFIIEPPDADCGSGEDDAMEDDCGNVLNVHHNQLKLCELVIGHRKRHDGSIVIAEGSDDGSHNFETEADLNAVLLELNVPLQTETPMPSTSFQAQTPRRSKRFEMPSKSSTPKRRRRATSGGASADATPTSTGRRRPRRIIGAVQREESPEYEPEEPVALSSTRKRRRKTTASGAFDRESTPASVVSSCSDLSMHVPESFEVVRDNLQWIATPRSSSIPVFPDGNYTQYNKAPQELFQLFFDDELLDLIAAASNEYAVKLDNVNPQITRLDLLRFIGIMVIGGYNVLPSSVMMWSSKDDTYNKLVAECMSSKRFLSIAKYIHFAPLDGFNPNDKMWKLRPLTDRLNENFKRHFVPEQHLSYDESMIAYYGRHGCKQFIKGKPLRFGYKVWCMNSPLGYCIAFDIYQGKNHRYNPSVEAKFGKCVTPLLYMIDALPTDKKELPYCFYFDNLFTGLPVLHFLKLHGYEATGTMRENRLPKNCPLPPKKTIQKKERGFSVSKSISGTSIKVTKWVDNNVVTMASTLYGEQPKDKAGRYSRADFARIEVQRPAVVAAYNRNMGGVDRMDQNIAAYRIATRKKKWWWSIFTWTIDVAIQNSWLLARKAGVNQTQLDFRRSLALFLAKTCADEARSDQSVRRMLRHGVPKAEIRYDGWNHYVEVCDRRRCAHEECKSQARSQCGKCNVGLCVGCFKSYHTMDRQMRE